MQKVPKLIDPVDRWFRRQRLRRWAYLAIAVYFLGMIAYWTLYATVPSDYSDIEDHFKYGSIGSDTDNGIPFLIWRILPEMFPEYLPDQQAFLSIPENARSYLDAYAQFGFLIEEGRDRPIGFSKRRDQIMRIGMNCAVCHVSTVRNSQGIDADRIYDQEPTYLTNEQRRIVVLGMPANTVNLQQYFEFLFACAADSRFTVDNVVAYIKDQQRLSAKEWLFYKIAAAEFREALLTRKKQLDYLYLPQFPEFGPGRVDTFTPYKKINFKFPYDDTVGTADFPSIWNQRPRVGMQLHWDGNNKSVFERNLSASIGAGATPVSVDLPRMLRVAEWIGSPDPRQEHEFRPNLAGLDVFPKDGELKVPQYPFRIDRNLADGSGKSIFQQHCAACHDWQGDRIGKVEDIRDIGTDPERLDSYTFELAANQNTLGSGHWWRFNNFRKTNGYANMPLDGIWARAPYLHNGSVPTLVELLKPEAQRVTKFYRGDDEYNPTDVGFKHDRPVSADGRKLFEFDTSLRGNSNSGHPYGTELPPADKRALLEYLKTL